MCNLDKDFYDVEYWRKSVSKLFFYYLNFLQEYFFLIKMHEFIYLSFKFMWKFQFQTLRFV